MLLVKSCILILCLSRSLEEESIEGDAIWRLECALGRRNDSDCPVEGGWGLWQPWGACSGECGHVGLETRERTCDNPSPSHGGGYCYGDHAQSRTCQLQGCSAAEYKLLVASDPIREAQLKEISRVHETIPCLATKCLENTCSWQSVKDSLGDGATAYWNALLCVKHSVGCPVHGGWSDWDDWSSCNAACGKGSMYRQRSCTNPRPTVDNLTCVGHSQEFQLCSGIACADILDGDWCDWSDWSSCSEASGPGFRKRERECIGSEDKKGKRTCNNITLVVVDLKIALESRCSGSSWEVQPCQNKNYDLDGGWSSWEDWTLCSQSCDLGVQVRSRSCSSPPVHGQGKPCVGVNTEFRHCYQQPCPVNSHQIAAFNGVGHLQYFSLDRPLRLLHVYVKFRPQAASGQLIHRYETNCVGNSCNIVSLNLEAGYLVWQARISDCVAIASSETKLNMEEWHEALLTVTGLKLSMRVNDATHWLESHFNCVPVRPELDAEMSIGEHFHGQIKRLTINFRPVVLRRNGEENLNSATIVPCSNSNVQFADMDEQVGEGYLRFADGSNIAAPCPPKECHNFQVEIAVKLETVNGLLLMVPSSNPENYITVVLSLGRVKLRVFQGEQHFEVTAPDDIITGQWLYVTLSVASVANKGNIGITVNGGSLMPVHAMTGSTEDESICANELFIGAVSSSHMVVNKYKREVCEMFPYLAGTLGFLAVNSEVVDIETLPATTHVGQQISSHTVSTADDYFELPTPLGQQINLSCFYRSHTCPSLLNWEKPVATWVLLDSVIDDESSKNGVDHEMRDDDRLSHLTISSYPTRESVEGFYLCWVERGTRARTVVAFGVPIVEHEFGGILGIWFDILGILTLIALLLMLSCILIFCCFCTEKPPSPPVIEEAPIIECLCLPTPQEECLCQPPPPPECEPTPQECQCQPTPQECQCQPTPQDDRVPSTCDCCCDWQGPECEKRSVTFNCWDEVQECASQGNAAVKTLWNVKSSLDECDCDEFNSTVGSSQPSLPLLPQKSLERHEVTKTQSHDSVSKSRSSLSHTALQQENNSRATISVAKPQTSEINVWKDMGIDEKVLESNKSKSSNAEIVTSNESFDENFMQGYKCDSSHYYSVPTYCQCSNHGYECTNYAHTCHYYGPHNCYTMNEMSDQLSTVEEGSSICTRDEHQ